MIEEVVEIVTKAVGRKIEPKIPLRKVTDIFTYLEQLAEELSDGEYVGENFSKGEYTLVKGILIAGDNVKLENYAYMRGIVILGDDVHVSAEMKNSVMCSNSKAVHRSIYIGDSLIGQGCNVAAGTQFANLRFDHDAPSLMLPSGEVEKTRKKLGAVVEDNVQFGANSVIAPGTYIPKGTLWIENKPLQR